MTGWMVVALATYGGLTALELLRRHVVGARFVRLQRSVAR